MSYIMNNGLQYEIPDAVVFISDKCTVDFSAHEVLYNDNKNAKIVPELMLLLSYLYENRKRFCNTNDICDYLFRNTERGYTDQIKSKVNRLRSLLKDEKPFKIIINSRGYGYKLIVSDREEDSGFVLVEKNFDKDLKSLFWLIKDALIMMVNANSDEEVACAKTVLKIAIDTYRTDVVRLIKSENISDYKLQLNDYADSLRDVLREASITISDSDIDEMLKTLKLTVLDYFSAWHIYLVFLQAAITMEQEAIRRANDELEKELHQNRKEKLYLEYSRAEIENDRRENSLDMVIDSYARDAMNSGPVK